MYGNDSTLAPYRALALMAVGVCLLNTTLAPAADVISTWNNSIGDWSDAGRWSSADFPNNGNGGLTYDAVVNGGTITLDQDIEIEALTLTNGTINGDFDLDVNLASTWSGGNFAGAGTTTFNGPLTITGLHSVQDTRTVNFAGATTFNGQNFFINSSAGATINNQSGAVFEIAGSSDVLGGTFNNVGTINKSETVPDDGLTLFSGMFNNSGTVNVNSGELRLTGGGTHTGDYNVAAGGLLSFNNGVHSIDAGTTIDGDGTTNFQSNNVTFTPAMFEIDTIATQTGGAIFGDGTLDFNHAFTWSGGNQAGAGVSNFNAPVAITGLHNLQNSRTLNFTDSTTFNGENQFINSAAGTTINNQSGAVFEIVGSSDLLGGTFNNEGTINKAYGDEMGDGLTVFSGMFNNTGTVNINSGEIRLTGGGTHTSDYNVAADGLLSFNNAVHSIDAGTTIDGAGTTNFQSNNVTFTPATFEIDTIATQTGGVIFGDGVINFNEAFTWSNGNQAGAGVSNFNAPVTITGLHNLQNTRTLNFADSTIYNGGNNQFINSAAGTTINFLEGSTLEIDGNSDLLNGTLNNAGTINKSAGDEGDGITLFSGAFTNTGTLNVDGGEVRLTAVFTNYDAGTDTLTGGTYNVTGTLQFQIADINTNQANITLNGPDSKIVSNVAATDALLDFATNDTGAFFGVVGNRDFTTTAATFTNRGQMQLGGGMFTAPILSNEAGGDIFGFGTIVPRPTNAGTIRAAGGTLTVPLGIQGGSGTVQIDSSATLNLSAAALGSSADMLIHNGTSLNLGANNFSVGVDYNNANFGVGNAFNARANVTGAGQINASPGVTQSLGGNVTGGGPTVTLAFGNVHVGDSPTLNYEIGNVTPGIGGPSLRGAVQTTVGGANLTDPRLTGAGVTAGNFGPIPVGEGSGNRAVTFNATTAGALTGQQVRVVNNFDNVGNQTLQFTGAAFRLANPTAHTPEPVNFGIIHVGDTVSQALSITNNVPNDGFSERLDASIGNPTGDAKTNSGSIASLNPGATDNTSLAVGVDTTTAGAKSGTATISLTSNGTGTSDLANTALTDQVVNIMAQVNNFAAASVVKVGGAGTLSMDGANMFTLDLGDVVQGQDIGTELGVTNTAAAPADSLAGMFTPNAADFILAGFGAFSGIAAGATHDGLSIEPNTTNVGPITGQITLQPQSTNPRPFSENLTPITINLAAEVTLAGDYNDDGTVNAADYVVWRNNNGQSVTLPGDRTPGSVTQTDYDVWVGNYGSSASGSGAAIPQSAYRNPHSNVPEPTSFVLLGTMFTVSFTVRRRNSRMFHRSEES